MSFITKIRKRGFFHLVETMFNRFVPPWIFRFSVGDVLELDQAMLSRVAEETRSGDFHCVCVTAADEGFDRLRETTWNSVPRATTLDDYGYAVAPAADAERFVGGVWGGVGTFLEANLGFQIQLQQNQAWIYCAYVDKEARGGGVYKRVLSFAAEDLKRRGYDQLRVIIQPWNKASMYVHGKYAKRKVGRVCVIRLFCWSFVFRSGEVTKDRTMTTRMESNPVLLRVS